MVPIKGGSDPTIAPTNVFQGVDCFMGIYTQRYENHTALDMSHV